MFSGKKKITKLCPQSWQSKFSIQMCLGAHAPTSPDCHHVQVKPQARGIKMVTEQIQFFPRFIFLLNEWVKYTIPKRKVCPPMLLVGTSQELCHPNLPSTFKILCPYPLNMSVGLGCFCLTERK